MKNVAFPAVPAQPLLLEVQRLLDSQKPERAFDLLNRIDRHDALMRNARAVCLMRLGRHDDAVNELAPIVLTGAPRACDPDAPTLFRANFVAAIALRGDPLQALSLLHDIPEQSHPVVQQLGQALRAWRRSVPLWQWPVLLVGGYPWHPLHFDFAPGWLMLTPLPGGTAMQQEVVATPVTVSLRR